MIRSQTVLVLVLIAMVIVWGAHSVVSEDAANVPRAIPAASSVAIHPTHAPVPTLAPRLEQTTAPTLASSPTPIPTIAPTPVPTEAPVATARPIPPDTGQTTSLLVDRGGSGRLEVAFTFDAGEGTGYTVEILDLFAEYGFVGTFGVTGQWAEQNPALMLRIVDEGHQIINHTYDHRSFTGESPGSESLTDSERREEVETTEQIIEDVTGGYRTRPFFRFPYGDYDAAALDLLGELGFSYTMWWSCDTQGWNGFTPEEIIEFCGTGSENGGPGAILLMHVANLNDWEATEPLIENYVADGYDFVTLEEMVQP